MRISASHPRCAKMFPLHHLMGIAVYIFCWNFSKVIFKVLQYGPGNIAATGAPPDRIHGFVEERHSNLHTNAINILTWPMANRL